MATFGRMHKATAIVPLAVLSAAWTVSLTGLGAGSATAADETGPAVLPDGTTLPTEAVEAPASVGEGQAREVDLTGADANDIPHTALAAYQRAQAVINQADTTCNIPWELIAAIGRVESDHARHGGNTLDHQGVARPGIYGIALDGSRNTQVITDTDGGEYDNDTEFDRAVGPMQFIPSTWSIVGVDGDSDGKRDPQDIDDAALATAVYLCSGNDDLSTEQGQRASVYRYNHSNDYVDLVLEIMQAYMDGQYATVADPAPNPLPDYVPPAVQQGGKGKGGGKAKGGKGTKGGSSSSGGSTSAPAPSPSPTATATPLPTSPVPTTTQAPLVPLPTELPTILEDPIVSTLTYAEAQAQCLATGITLLQVAKLNECIVNLLGG